MSNTECCPSCISKFEIIAGYCIFELAFESNQVGVSRRNAVTSRIWSLELGTWSFLAHNSIENSEGPVASTETGLLAWLAASCIHCMVKYSAAYEHPA